MPYEVTATRRRPRTFDELAGQEFVAATLKNSLKTGHIAQAYLFSGPRGCGKTSTARILARALRCEKGPAENPCGVCPQCLETGRSMDVIEIDGASNTGVNDVRQIKEEVLFPPSTGRYKVYIIDEVHMLSNNAFNALLKTIEEPPPNIIFIFATTELQKVPATIKSRCQQFNFRLIPADTIKALLREACDETGISADDEALFWIARESTGSLRDAYTLFDQVVSFSGGHISPELIREKLGLAGLEKLNEFAEACAANDLAGVLSRIDVLLEAGVAVEQFVVDLANYYHSLLLIKAGIGRESVLGYPLHRFSVKVLEKLDTVRLAHAGELLFDLHRDIRYSVSPRFELETLASKLCWLDRWVSPPDLADAVKRAGELLKGGRPFSGSDNSRDTGRSDDNPRDDNLRDDNLRDDNPRNVNSADIKSADEKSADNKSEVSFNALYNQWQANKQEKGPDLMPPPMPKNRDNEVPEFNPGVQNVLRIFNGTIVDEKQEISSEGTGNEH